MRCVVWRGWRLHLRISSVTETAVTEVRSLEEPTPLSPLYLGRSSPLLPPSRHSTGEGEGEGARASESLPEGMTM